MCGRRLAEGQVPAARADREASGHQEEHVPRGADVGTGGPAARRHWVLDVA